MVLNPRGSFPLARTLHAEGAALEDVFSFVSGLYFRGKAAYARAFARAPEEGDGAFVISAGNQTSVPQLTSAYRGQEFIWRDFPAWDTLAPSDWLSWSILHTAPVGEEKIILWTRGDIFIDAQNASTP